jgi:hypothetical protein
LSHPGTEPHLPIGALPALGEKADQARHGRSAMAYGQALITPEGAVLFTEAQFPPCSSLTGWLGQRRADHQLRFDHARSRHYRLSCPF